MLVKGPHPAPSATLDHAVSAVDVEALLGVPLSRPRMSMEGFLTGEALARWQNERLPAPSSCTATTATPPPQEKVRSTFAAPAVMLLSMMSASAPAVEYPIHGTTKRQVAVMFAEEQPALGPLPLEPFRYYRYGERTVHLDGCVEVEAAYYGAPPGWIGQRVQVQWNDLHVRLLAPKTGQLLREHLRAPRGWHRLHDDDRPARTPSSTVALLARATTAGPSISAVCTYIHQHDGAAGVRRMLGVLALAKKHGPAVVDEAAKAALDLGVPTYRFLRRYLERRLPAPLTLRQVDPLIRQLTLYRDLIDRKTGDPL